MKCVAKFVPQLLLPEQKEHCAAVVKDLIQIATSEPDFLRKVITRDEWWVNCYDQEMKGNSSQWKSTGSPCLKKAWQSCNRIKTVNCFLIGKVLSLKVFGPSRTNNEYCLSVLHWLRETIQ